MYRIMGRMVGMGVILGMAAGAGLAAPSSQSSGGLAPSVCQISSTPAVTSVVAPGRREAFYCWGLLHARERGRQMHVLRQTGRGRLAEERGMAFVRGDYIIRLLELERRAVQISAKIPPQEFGWLDAYAAGVNDGSPSQFSRDRWKVSDTVLFLLLQSFDQTRRTFEQDIAVDRLARKGEPLLESFPWQTPILKPGEYESDPRAEHAGVRHHEMVRPFKPEDEGTGSNSWVVSGKHTRSGHALLANDPHLQLKSPPFWHWIRLSWPGFEIVGAGVPGVPVLASGASLHLAWGLTNSYVDVADAVLVPRRELKTRSLRPLVWVKKWGMKLPLFFKKFEVVQGVDLPVLPIESPEKDHAIVVRWTGFDVTAEDLSALWSLGEARNAREMDLRLSRVGVPSWNYVFADTEGNVGYRVVGRLPKRPWRARGRMEVVSAAQLSAVPLLSAQEAPHVLNPPRGWIATANQLQWGRDGRNSVGSNHTESFRGFRIEELLKEGLSSKHSLESFQKIQCDRQAVDARFLLPLLLKGLPPSDATARLATWDFETGIECRECAVYRLWMEELGDPQWIYARAREGSSGFWLEAQQALDRALVKLSRVPGGPWVMWGDVHRAGFPVTEIPRPFPLALADALPTFGDNHTVSPGSSDWVEGEGDRSGFSHHSGASQRLIVELSNPPRIHWVLPGANRSDTGILEQEKATSSDREEWAGCRLRELTGWNTPSVNPRRSQRAGAGAR